MKKNIVIKAGSLKMGGLERILVEYLQNLNEKIYNVSLIIENDFGNNNIFYEEVPKWMDIYFLKSEKMTMTLENYKNKKKNIVEKIIYNFKLTENRNFVIKKTKQVLKLIEKNYKNIDVFIDFDMSTRKYIEKLDLKRKILWQHNSIPKALKKAHKIKKYGITLKKYDKIIAICDDMKSEMEDLYPYLKSKIERIYNPFNFDRIEKLSNYDTDLNQELKDRLQDEYIVAVSRLDSVQKDFATLIKGYKLAVENGVKEKLYVIGEGPARKEIETLILENNLENKVVLLGQIKNPYIWMKNSKLFVHSSKYEGFGLVLVEAMICGKMIISSDCPIGPSEILENGKVGKLFKVGDYEKLGFDLIEILKNEEKRKKYEKLSYERKDVFHVNNIIKQFDELI